MPRRIAFPYEDLRDFIFAETDSIPRAGVFDRKGRMIIKTGGSGPAIEKRLGEAVALALKTE